MIHTIKDEGFENMKEFNVGDVVRIISGSPKMTVTAVSPYYGTVKCTWFEGGEVRTANVDIASLELVTDKLPKTRFTSGHCRQKSGPGGCQLHNLQCGYPGCDIKEVSYEITNSTAV